MPDESRYGMIGAVMVNVALRPFFGVAAAEKQKSRSWDSRNGSKAPVGRGIGTETGPLLRSSTHVTDDRILVQRS
jgi:hypothetical protein